MGEDAGNRAAWQDAVVRAAAEASRLQPLAGFLLAAAVLLIVGQHLAAPLAETSDHSDDRERITHVLSHLVEALPSIALAWALWETRRYLARLAKGEVWGAATTNFLGRVGDCLLWAAVLAAFVVPNLTDWIQGGFHGFNFDLEADFLVLAGLGLLLSLIGRVVRNVVEVAATLKAENDQIV